MTTSEGGLQGNGGTTHPAIGNIGSGERYDWGSIANDLAAVMGEAERQQR